MSDHIRPEVVMQAREAIARGVMDTPERLGAAVDVMVHRERLDEAERDLMDGIVGGEIEAASKCAFWTDYEG